MRAITVSEMKRQFLSKRRNKSRQGVSTQPYPREGSLARTIYDLLAEHKGRSVEVPRAIADGRAVKAISGAVAQLRLFYGLDIRCCKHKGFGGRGQLGKRQETLTMCLVGEWFGPDYVDYAAQARRAGDVGEELTSTELDHVDEPDLHPTQDPDEK